MFSNLKLIVTIFVFASEVYAQIQPPKTLRENKIQLNLFSWDCDEPLVTLRLVDIQTLLKRCMNNQVSILQLEQWAEFVECREDIAFEEAHKEKISAIIHNLANPEIEGEVNYAMESVIFLCKPVSLFFSQKIFQIFLRPKQ